MKSKLVENLKAELAAEMDEYDKKPIRLSVKPGPHPKWGEPDFSKKVEFRSRLWRIAESYWYCAWVVYVEQEMFSKS